MMEVKRSKKSVERFLVAHVNLFLKGEANPSKIAKEEQTKVQNVKYYFDKLIKTQLLKKVGYATYQLTEKGIVTTKKLTRGGSITDKNIELWNFGFKFLIEHDQPIPELKRTIGLNGNPDISQGRIVNCWVKKTKEELTILSPIQKDSNLWSATTKAVLEINACKKFIEDNYHLLLMPFEATYPDIIIKNPILQNVAKNILNTWGRIRTDTTDIDISKSQDLEKPDYELHKLEHVQTVLDNMALIDKSDVLLHAINDIRGDLGGMLQQQTAISNAILLQTKILKDMNNPTRKIRRFKKAKRIHRLSAYWKDIRQIARKTHTSIEKVRRIYKKLKRRKR